MVSTRNTRRSNANLPRMQNPTGDADNRPPDTFEAMQANTNEVEALRLVNQLLIGELEQLTRQIQRPRDTRQAQEGHNFPPHEGQHNLDIHRGAETVSLDDVPEHLAYIGSKLAEDLKGLLTQFLKHNKDVFAWKQADMGGIDHTVITHRLNASPSFKPVKQKRRSFMPERQKAINEEVDKLLQVGAIREVEYHEWLANVVLVKKANGK